MSDERDPRVDAKIRDSNHGGHDIGERKPSREQRQANIPPVEASDEDSTRVSRTSREPSPQDEEGNTVSKRVLRRTGGEATTQSRTGNLSETGATATPSEGGGSRTAPTLPGKPAGCTSTAGVLLFSVSAVGVAVARIVRR